MAKYSYAVIRRAIACKIMDCKKIKWEFIDDVSDWAIYKEEKETYHLIKFTSNTQDGYKFPFDESKIVEHYDDNIINIFKFLHFNNSKNQDEVCEDIDTIKDVVDFNFYLVLNMNNDVANFEVDNNISKEFKYIELNKELFSCNNETKIQKISKCFNSLTNTGFKVKNNPINSNDYEINLYTYPCSYNVHTESCNLCRVKISNDDCNKINNIKNEKNLSNIDYNRILERSFIYQIEYGTVEEFEEILNTYCKDVKKDCCKNFDITDCKFEGLKEFIKTNQENLKNNDLIRKFNKLEESKKNELKIYDFKNIFKCFFEDNIKRKEFEKKFFQINVKRKCAYCGVPENKLNLLYTVRAGRGNRLEYDRIISRDGDNKVRYTLNNIVLACYWCNNAKTDTFSPKDFKPIAKGINQVWNKKLRKSGELYKKILFPNKSKIWKIKEN